jgi:predicted transcriptional regulator
MSSEEKLKTVSDQIKKGIAAPRETVRSFLLWFGASKRGYRVSRRIKARLEAHGLRTDPDFEYAYIDGPISFLKASLANTDTDSSLIDPTHRIARLTAANRPPVTVKPDTTLQQAVTLMMTHNYSQLPVMTSAREVKGIISWKSIGSRLALKRPCACARDCMEAAREVSVNDSLFSAISSVAECDYVLVRALDQQICGIITASDLTEQFQKLAEPFLLVGEIENGVRRLLHGKFTKDELAAVKLPGDTERTVEAISDLTFGEYVRLLESEANWKKLRLEIDRTEFTKRLNEIREIRNDVMHFDPDGLNDEDLKSLREFTGFLRRLREAGVA